ncbi:ABC transporter permease [Haloimpatiens sp. FM7315]|uniref:ABC transporter permease n=1 Tax=Haloimpatiens sp. FM7315 TaxID=3298609 RepID=UPI003977CE97
MTNIISSEFYKILRSKIFYVISIVLLAINVIAFAIAEFVQKSDRFSIEVKSNILNSGLGGYPRSFDGDGILYIILIFTVSIVAANYTSGGIRQMACRGIARWKLVLGQYIAVSSIITITMIVFGVIGVILNTIVHKLGSVDTLSFIWMNLGLICIFWSITGLGFLISYIFKSAGISIVIFFLLIIGLKLASSILVTLTKNDIYAKFSLSNMKNTIIDLTSKTQEVLIFSIIFLAIGVISVLGSMLVFTKRDVN